MLFRSVSVAAIGLADVARPRTPADWFTQVTRGNIDRYMPPFVSLSEQERWDVVAYALSLHTSSSQFARGREIFEENCSGCPLGFFTNLKEMAALSDDELVALLKNGGGDISPLGGNLSEDDFYAAAAYLRTLTFASEPTPVAASTATAAASMEITPAKTDEIGRAHV